MRIRGLWTRWPLSPWLARCCVTHQPGPGESRITSRSKFVSRRKRFGSRSSGLSTISGLCRYYRNLIDNTTKCTRFFSWKNLAGSHRTIYDLLSRRHYLKDIGSEVSIFTASRNNHLTPQALTVSANSSPTRTYGFRQVDIILRLWRTFSWRFIIANISSPILGADLVWTYGLLVNLHNRSTFDRTNSLRSSAEILTCISHSFWRYRGLRHARTSS